MSSSQARRLLFLLPFPPRLKAAHGGSRVIAQFLMALSTRHEVGILYLRAADEEPAEEALLARCAIAEEVARPMVVSSWPRRLRLALSLLRGVPMWASDWNVPAYTAQAASIVDCWQPDVINAEFHIMAQYLPALAGQGVPTVVTHHEPGIVAAEGLLQAQHGLARLLYQADLQAWRRYEGTILKQTEAVVVFTEEDRQKLRPFLGDTPAACIPRSGVLPPHASNPLGVQPPTLLFVGNFAHFPNVDAAFRLVNKIFPRIRQQRPDTRLYIVGPDPPDRLLTLRDDKVLVTGLVDDVGFYLERAAVVVAPLRLGGGMRVKIIEALAAGKAIVATPPAVAGLPLYHNQELLIAEDDGDFADAVISLLESPERRMALAKEARAWASHHLDWQTVVTAYERLYDWLLCSGEKGDGRSKEVREDALHHV